MSNLILPKRFHRQMTVDNAFLTIDGGTRVIDAAGNMQGRRFDQAYRTHDNRTMNSTNAFLVGELERLDQSLHDPLAAVSWGRDIDLREDVSLGDEVSSFTLSSFGSAGSLGAGNGIRNGKAWIGKATDQVGGVDVDIAKVPHALHIWALETKWTIMELESAARLGRPVDEQKLAALKLKHQMDIDEMVYVGDSTLSATGLVNNSLVTNVSNLANGAASSPKWSTKTPDEILADFNTALNSVWAASAYAVMPGKVLLPPSQFGYIATQKVSNAGNISILKYILENNLIATSQGKQLEIQPVKWLVGAGAGGTLGTAGTTDRMVVYTQDKDRVRYPMTLLQRTPVQFDSIYHKSTYYCRLGETEVVYPETLGYFDGL